MATVDRRNRMVEATPYRLSTRNEAARHQSASIRVSKPRVEVSTNGVCIINELCGAEKERERAGEEVGEGPLFRLAARPGSSGFIPPPSPPLVESHVFVPRAPLMPRILNYSAAAHTRVPPPSRNSSAIDSAQRDRRCISVFSISLSRFFPRILCNAEGTVYHAKWPSHRCSRSRRAGTVIRYGNRRENGVRE